MGGGIYWGNFFLFNPYLVSGGLPIYKYILLNLMIKIFSQSIAFSLHLPFPTKSDKMICSLQPLAIQQFVKSFHLGVQN